MTPKKLKSYFDNLNDHFNEFDEFIPGTFFRYILDKKDNEYLDCTKLGFEKIFGVKIDLISSVVEYVNQAIHKDDINGLHACIEKSRQNKKSLKWLGRIKPYTGTYKWVKITGRYVKIGDYDVWTGLIEDISEKVIQKERTEMLAIVAERTQNTVIITDKLGLITWVNKAFTYLTGYIEEEVLGLKPKDFLRGPLTGKKVTNAMSKKLWAKEPFLGDIYNYRKDGSGYWVSVNITPIKDGFGEIEGFISVQTVVTEQKEFEKELIEAKKNAEQASIAKTNFLSTMSHEIRTPLNGIIGISNLLLDEDTLPNQLDNLKTLKFSSESLLSIINDILDFNKIEAGKLDIDISNFDLKEMLSKTLQTYCTLTKEKNLYLNLEIDDDVPKYITGDPTKLGQVVSNLVSNGIKFTNEGGIKIGVNIASKSKGKVVLKYSILDTGIGIKKNKHKTIFDSFTQANNTTSRKYGGSGLGLAISKQLVDLMGGSIRLNSEPKKGSEFNFEIEHKVTSKLEINPSEKLKPIEEYNKAYKSPIENNVLLVDDNEINIKVATRFISKWGYKVDSAKNGLEAIKKVKENNYDLIFMDLMMPIMDGYEAVTIIRALDVEYAKNIPIIALTASVLQETRTKVFDVGMNDYILKPFQPYELQNILKKYFGFNKAA